MPDLKIPTDEEISQMFGGIPVTSYRPEDFPHFKPTIHQSYDQAEMNDRIQAVADHWIKFCPEIDLEGVADLISNIAVQLSASITSIHLNGVYKPSVFLLLRPSEQIDPTLKLANDTGLKINNVRSNIPDQDREYISTYHEIGHMNVGINGLIFNSKFEEEFYSEIYAYTKYCEENGSLDVINSCVRERALSGFFRQPSKYWMAPKFAHNYMDSTDNNKKEFIDCWKSCAELRFRVADKIEGENCLIGINQYPSKQFNNDAMALLSLGNDKVQGYDLERHALEQYSSEQIHKALVSWDNGKISEVKDLDLRFAILAADEAVNSDILVKYPEMAFTALDEIISSPNVDDFTKENAHQILEAAAYTTIGLLPDLISDRYVNNKDVSTIEAPDEGDLPIPISKVEVIKTTMNPNVSDYDVARDLDMMDVYLARQIIMDSENPSSRVGPIVRIRDAFDTALEIASNVINLFIPNKVEAPSEDTETQEEPLTEEEVRKIKKLVPGFLEERVAIKQAFLSAKLDSNISFKSQQIVPTKSLITYFNKNNKDCDKPTIEKDSGSQIGTEMDFE